MKTQLAELPKAERLDMESLAARVRNGSVNLICVLGPTASGKTRFAVRIAREIGLPCEIISADSRQVYRGMDIGTGKDLSDYCGIPYHLIDVADPGEQYNVWRFLFDFRKAYADIVSRGNVPILCGGTGLYLNAVINGYDFKDSRPLSAPRSRMDEAEVSSGLEAGALASDAAGGAEVGGVGYRPYIIGTLVDRETRNARIDARLDARLNDGMVDEIRGLIDAGVSPDTLIGYGLEYKFVTLYILGRISYNEMRTLLSTAIHQFAKRQMTWFRGMERSGVRIHWVESY